MFETHLYTFGGETFLQLEGGPIGLGGTCAIARVVMCMFDGKWMARLVKMCLKIKEYMRYMDDGRILLPAFRPGWRWVNGELKFTLAWEREDASLTPQEITRRVIQGTLGDIHPFLQFTTEIGDEFPDGWLPTLDLKVRVNGDNQVEYMFYEKPTNTNVGVMLRSAMEENSKVRGLGNELVRYFLNTGEENAALHKSSEGRSHERTTQPQPHLLPPAANSWLRSPVLHVISVPSKTLERSHFPQRISEEVEHFFRNVYMFFLFSVLLSS